MKKRRGGGHLLPSPFGLLMKLHPSLSLCHHSLFMNRLYLSLYVCSDLSRDEVTKYCTFFVVVVVVVKDVVKDISVRNSGMSKLSLTNSHSLSTQARPFSLSSKAR